MEQKNGINKEATLIKVLMFLIGLLIGLGTAHVTTMSDVKTNSVKLDLMNEAIRDNSKTIDRTLDLVGDVVNQNTVLINSIVKDKP